MFVDFYSDSIRTILKLELILKLMLLTTILNEFIAKLKMQFDSMTVIREVSK